MLNEAQDLTFGGISVVPASFIRKTSKKIHLYRRQARYTHVSSTRYGVHVQLAAFYVEVGQRTSLPPVEVLGD